MIGGSDGRTRWNQNCVLFQTPFLVLGSRRGHGVGEQGGRRHVVRRGPRLRAGHQHHAVHPDHGVVPAEGLGEGGLSHPGEGAHISTTQLLLTPFFRKLSDWL